MKIILYSHIVYPVDGSITTFLLEIPEFQMIVYRNCKAFLFFSFFSFNIFIFASIRYSAFLYNAANGHFIPLLRVHTVHCNSCFLLICDSVTLVSRNQRTNGPVNAHLRSAAYTNKHV